VGSRDGWETGPTDVVFLTPNAGAAQLTIPKRIYAGYLTRFG
jgi:hypothetical protein